MTLLSKPSISMEDVRNTIDTYIKDLSDELYTLNKQVRLYPHSPFNKLTLSRSTTNLKSPSKNSKLILIFPTSLNNEAMRFNEGFTTYLHHLSLYMAPKADVSTSTRSMMPFLALGMLVVTT
jgi:hypothetical protein